jgi:hypothetical protein
VFEKKVLRRIFGLRREEITGGCGQFYSEELLYLYSIPILVMILKSVRMRWAGM